MSNQDLTYETNETAIDEIYQFIAYQVRIGVDDDTIIQKLNDSGISNEDAKTFLANTYAYLYQLAESETLSFRLLMSVVGVGILAALVGGIIWGLIVIAINYEIGFMAWGLGFACGYFVRLIAKGRAFLAFRLIAVLSSVLGILIGKYIFFFHYLKQALIEEYGAEIVSGISIFSIAVFQTFIENIDMWANGLDLLWIVLAVITAWKLPD